MSVNHTMMSDNLQVYRMLEQKLPASDRRRLVLLTGARQTGKTTLSKEKYPDIRYINLDAPENREIRIGEKGLKALGNGKKG